jgi:hypothetical protein
LSIKAENSMVALVRRGAAISFMPCGRTRIAGL